MRDRGSRGGGVDARGPKVEPMSSFMSERAGMFSPRSRDVLEHLSPRRRDVLLAAFPVRGHSLNSMSSSVSMSLDDGMDLDQQEDPIQVKVSPLHICRFVLLFTGRSDVQKLICVVSLSFRAANHANFMSCGRLPTLGTSGDVHCGLLPLQYRPCDGRQCNF